MDAETLESHHLLDQVSSDSRDILAEEEQVPDFINQLPNELLEKIFKELAPLDLYHVGLVCVRFNELSKHERLWKSLSLSFGDYSNNNELARKSATFIELLVHAPGFKEVKMDSKDIRYIFSEYCREKKVKILSLVRLPSLFQCFDCTYLEEIHVKFLDRTGLDEILALPHLKKLYVVLFLEDCSGHPGHISKESGCLETLLVKLPDHKVLCGIIEHFCKSLRDLKIFADLEDGPTHLMDKIIMCNKLSTLAISHIEKSHLLLDMVQLHTLILWPDPDASFHVEYLQHLPPNIEYLTLSSWIAEDIEEHIQEIVRCCKRLQNLKVIKIYTSEHIKEKCDLLIENMGQLLSWLTISCLDDEEELFCYT